MRLRAKSTFLIALWILAHASGPFRADECAGYYTGDELDEWKKYVATDRPTGTDPHLELIDHLECQLRKVKASPPELEISRYERRFTRWDPAQPELEGESWRSAPLGIWPVPYSGITDARGVSAELMYEGPVGLGVHFDAKRHAGKIVVVKVGYPWWLAGVLTRETKHAIPAWKEVFVGDYWRAIVLELLVPSLAEARRAGAHGLIVVIDADPEIARRQYVPFTRSLQALPAAYVDRNLGATVIAAAQRHEWATLRHEGRLAPDAPVDHVVAILPATEKDKIDDQIIVINTHTDGPNWFEENGVVALWSLLRAFADEKHRPRDLVFVFASAHFARPPGSMDDVIRRYPKLFARGVRAALTIEHLGAIRWSADGKDKTRTEPTLIETTKHDKSLNELAIEVVTRHAKAQQSLRPIYFLKPSKFKYGEGKFLEEAGFPTIAFLPNPAYLLSENGQFLNWFSSPLMCTQLGMLRELIDKMWRLGPKVP